MWRQTLNLQYRHAYRCWLFVRQARLRQIRWYRLSDYGRVRPLAALSRLMSVPGQVQPSGHALALPWVRLLVL